MERYEKFILLTNTFPFFSLSLLRTLIDFYIILLIFMRVLRAAQYFNTFDNLMFPGMSDYWNSIE